MDEQAIVAAFTAEEGFPRAALLAASEQRDQLAPRFIQLIEDYLHLPAAERPKQTPIFFIFHLLGEWREHAAYRPLARLLRLPDEEISAILGDAVTGTTNRVMINVFDGDPEPLLDIILAPNADEFVRSRMCDALVTLVLTGAVDRKRAATFLRDGFTNLRPGATNYVWVGWMMAIANLGLKELSGIVETAFKRRYIDPGVCGYHHFVRDLAQAETEEGRKRWLEDDEYTPFGNTIEEFSRWHGFSAFNYPQLL